LSISWQLAALSIAYLVVLFVIAWHGDRNTGSFGGLRAAKWFYPLSIGVYVTSWTYYGAVGSAASNGWGFLPIYLGPMIMFLSGWPIIAKFAEVARTHRIGSLADFMSARYGRFQPLAILTTVIALLGTIPYIALQLKAVGQTFNIMSGSSTNNAPQVFDTAFFAAVCLTIFAILFGTRLPGHRRDQNRGMMIAIAFESIVKLVAFVLVGIFCVFDLFDGFDDLFTQVNLDPTASAIFNTNFSQWSFATHFLLAGVAIICLPSQFHVTFVEAPDPGYRQSARWIFPLYLAGFVLFVVPIAAAGLLKFGNLAPKDAFVLLLPMTFNNEPLAALAFLGGLSAATGMILVSTLALAIMAANELILPLIFRTSNEEMKKRQDFTWLILLVRRLCIVGIMTLAWLYYQSATNERSLAAIGLIAFTAAAQFAPALFGGLYWRNGNRYGALTGMLLGLIAWAVILVLPEINLAPWPTAIPILGTADPVTTGVLVSLGLNIFAYILVSLLTTSRLVDRVQAAAFVDVSPASSGSNRYFRDGDLRVADLTTLVSRFIGNDRVQLILEIYIKEHQLLGLNDKDPAPSELINGMESMLAQEIGRTSARLVIHSAAGGKKIHLSELVSLVDEASSLAKKNQELLQKAIEHLPQGISVVDQNQNLVAWNRRYQELFDYPGNLLVIGRSVTELFRHNASKGLVGNYITEEQIAAAVERRLDHLNKGSAYRRESNLSSGITVEIIGQPMPNGGYVTSYSDITTYKETESALRESEQAIRVYTDNLPAMIAYVDEDYRTQFINKAFERTMQVWREQVIGQPNSQIFTESEFAYRKPYLERAMSGRRQRFEVSIDREDDTKEFEALYVPHRTESGDVQGIFVLYQDVTERNEAKRALETANETLEVRVAERTKELQSVNQALKSENERRAATESALTEAVRATEQANRSKTRFLAAASHDLLQPLNAARLFTTVLSEQANTKEARELTTLLEGSLSSAENLISTLLEISKLDAGILQADLRAFSLDELFEQLSQEFQLLAKSRQINFKAHPKPVIVHTDPKLLRRVLQNFLSNALRYTESGGRVLFGVRTFGEQVRIEIWDTGIGMHPDDIPTIFDEFKRLSDGVKTEKAGLGLGLSISKRICNLLGLELKTHSKPGVGSCFSVSLPRSDATPESLAQRSQKISNVLSKPLTGRTVLVIDNDKSILTGMAALLSGWGAKVITGERLKDATQACREHPEIQLALIDYHLDSENLGVDIITVLHALKSELVCALITADRSDEMFKQARAVGATVLHKPLKPAALRSFITQKLRRLPLPPSA
jgi:PAS domain S-box-containing protein